MTSPGPEAPGALLRQLEQRARRRFGQHFLARPDIVERMVRGARVRPGDRVLEIGPGLGILTRQLLAAGADLTAIELDRDLYGYLSEAFPTVNLIEGDATKVDWAELCPGTGWKVVANLPYNVGTGVVMDLLRSDVRFESITVMLQAEVVDRMVASAGGRTYGALTVQLCALGCPRFLLPVPPGAFVPPPKVRSAVVRIEPYDSPQVGGVTPEQFDRVVKSAFSQRRKMLRNALVPLFGRERATQALERAGIAPTLRAEQVDLDGFRSLALALYPSATPGVSS